MESWIIDWIWIGRHLLDADEGKLACPKVPSSTSGILARQHVGTLGRQHVGILGRLHAGILGRQHAGSKPG